jgi:hypothetical protein
MKPNEKAFRFLKRAAANPSAFGISSGAGVSVRPDPVMWLCIASAAKS